ncbi:hypothetical protein D3C79_1012330 [compost metagenome]
MFLENTRALGQRDLDDIGVVRVFMGGKAHAHVRVAPAQKIHLRQVHVGIRGRVLPYAMQNGETLFPVG